MVSVKERARIAAQIEQITKRNERQKDAIARLLVIQMECVAALGEISEISKESHRIAEWEGACARASERARLALERIEEMAAATREVAERLLRGEEPTTDEENDDESQH